MDCLSVGGGECMNVEGGECVSVGGGERQRERATDQREIDRETESVGACASAHNFN